MVYRSLPSTNGPADIHQFAWGSIRLTYLELNISAGEPKRYAEIMGCKERGLKEFVKNILN